MNNFAISGSGGEGRTGPSTTSGEDESARYGRLYAVGTANARVTAAVARRSYVSISVDADGHIDFESEVEPHDAEKMTDVLLLMLLKAREARKRS